MIRRACSDPQSEESEIHFSQSCVQFHNERNGEILNSEDVFSSLDTQISFIKKFKIVARKWKILLEIEPSTILMDPPAPGSVMRLMELQFVICLIIVIHQSGIITLHYCLQIQSYQRRGAHGSIDDLLFGGNFNKGIPKVPIVKKAHVM